MDAAELQALLKPACQALRVRLEHFTGRLWACVCQAVVRQPPECDQLLLSRWRTGLAEPQLLCLSDVAAHTRASQSGPARDATLAVLVLPATNDFLNVHAAELPIGHATPVVEAACSQNGAASGL